MVRLTIAVIVLLCAVGGVLIMYLPWSKPESDTERQKREMRNPDRVITITNKDKHYDVPSPVNAFFACSDINMILDKNDPIGDTILYQQEPWTGHVVVDGQKFSCRAAWDATSRHSGTIDRLEPGESVSIPIPLR